MEALLVPERKKNMVEEGKRYFLILSLMLLAGRASGALKVKNQMLFFFDKVHVDGALDVFIEKGKKRGKMSIYADSEIIDSVVAKVQEKTLFLDANNSFKIGRRIPFIRLNAERKFPVEVVISVEKISEITLLDQSNLTCNGIVSDRLQIFAQSSGKLHIEGLSSPAVQIQHDGTGTIVLNGNEVAELNLEMTNSGSLDGRAFSIEKVKVVHRGSGTTHLRPKKWLDARIHSSGQIFLYGKPDRMVVDQVGSGSVRVISE